MTALKSVRTLAVSLGVLAIGAMAASPAMAFDNLEWNWQKDVKEKVTIDAYVDIDVDSTGMVEIEKLQIFLGDVKAKSWVHDIYNIPNPDVDDDHNYPGGNPKPKPKTYGSNDKGKGGNYDPCKNNKSKGCGPSQPNPPTPPAPPAVKLNATIELPIVLSSATAVGNNQSITTDVPVFLHDGQFVANVKDHGDYGCGQNSRKCQAGLDIDKFAAALPNARTTTSKGSPGGYNHGPEGNLHTDIAALFALGAVTGILTKADIEAESIVHKVRNVSVDSSATAVANNLSVTLASDVDGTGPRNGNDRLSNHVVIGDITQFALANVEATSKVYDVKAEGYSNMRQLKTDVLSQKEGDPGYTIAVPTPWISSVATAVGNNVSITVGRDLTPTPKP